MFSSDLLQQSNLSTQWDPHTPLISHQIWSTFHRSSHSHYTIHHHEPRRKNGFIVTIYVGFEYIAFSYQYALCGFGINILFSLSFAFLSWFSFWIPFSLYTTRMELLFPAFRNWCHARTISRFWKAPFRFYS